MSARLKIAFLSALMGGSAAAVNPEVADPTVFRDADGLYYLYGTGSPSDNGFPFYTSADLDSWRGSESKALTPGDAFGTKGFWAPQVFRHDGRYYMFYTADEQIAFAVSDSPAGPFKGGSRIESSFKQIDPYVFFDTDGTPYLYFVRLDGGNRIFVGRLDDNLAAVDQSTVTHCITADLPWENTTGGYRVTEGPTVIKRDGVYHLFYSANDFRNPDYAVGHATATSPYGPWTKSPEPVITRRDIGVNGTGHGDMFVDGVGALRYVFHTHNSDSKVSPRLTWIVTLDPVTFRPVPGSARSLTVE